MEARYGDVRFRLAGRDYAIRYGNLAWDRVNRVLGTASPAQVLALVFGEDRARDAFLHAGFAAYHPELTLEQVRVLYDELARDGERSLWDATWEAVGFAMPELKILDKAARPNDEPAAAASPKTPAKRSGKRR